MVLGTRERSPCVATHTTARSAIFLLWLDAWGVHCALQNGALSVNGEKASSERALTSADLLHGTTTLLRHGNKQWHALEWS